MDFAKSSKSRHFPYNHLGIFGVHYGDPSFLLDIPPPRKATAPDGYRFNDGDFKRPLWIDPKFPYLVLLPRFNPFYGPLFSRLNLNEKTVPIVEVSVPGSSFGQFSSRWGLEQKIVDSWLFLESLLRLTLRTMMGLYGSRPAEAVYTFLSPISYCYTERNATSHSNAVKIALRSRDAARLSDQTKLHRQWIVDLEQSAVGNMNIDRKQHLDHHLPRHARWLLPHLLGKHRVPLYFFYGKDLPLKQPIPDALANLGFVPTQGEYEYLNGLNGEVAFSPWSVKGAKWQSHRNGRPPRLPLPRPPPSTPFPAVERDSGQKPGEDIHAFMERHRLHNEKRAQHESFDARKARLAREQHASGGTAPGKKGARALAPTEIAEPDNFDDDDGDDDFFFHQPPASTDVLPPLPDVPGRVYWRQKTGERAAEVLEHAYGCQGWNIQDARSIITSRFGFVENSTVPASSRKMQDKACGWALGDETWSVPPESGLPALFQHILDANDLKSVSANLMDIASSDSDLENDWNIDVKMLRMQDRILYELFPRGSHSSSPSILLESAAAVLQVLRSGWGNNSDVETIIRNLVKLDPLSTRRSPPPIQPTLGRRHAGYTPTLVDYGVYVERRNSFLRSRRRLARLVLSDFEDLACYDPYEDVLKSGVRVEAARDGDTILWHETLTQDEVDIICGVYIVETGQKSSATEGGQQLKYISWWPTPLRSGLQVSIRDGGTPTVSGGL
ncbi:hypothetical protein R3P38DRAFT_3337916 [Favolaschia claudopus]|uniref:Uncharacterized protein n=1 Tax=Favolaschia claudopus TaxID=2862362 RepID=A0AAV9YZX2_9AGAR